MLSIALQQNHRAADDHIVTWLSSHARALRHLGQGREPRNTILAATFFFTALAWPTGAALGAPAANVTGLAVAATTLLLPAAAWAWWRRRFADVECAALLMLFSFVTTVQVLSYQAPNIRWACAVGLISVPLLTLMMTRIVWIVAASTVSAAGQLAVVASIPATPLETFFAVAIICTVLPLNVGNATLLMRRTRALRAQAERAACLDHLTGLLNRRGLRELWPQVHQRAQRSGQQAGVLLIDVDHFKRINDEHGHDTGDAVLVALGGYLARSVRAGALVVRLGGEEFAVFDVFPDAVTAGGVAERVRRDVLQVGSACAVAVSLSIGVATTADLQRPDGDPEVLGALLSAADAALYRAKSAGRDRVVLVGTHAAGPVVSRP